MCYGTNGSGGICNPALRAQSIAVDKTTQYSFPSSEEIRNLALPSATLANISLSPSFLDERAVGKILQAHDEFLTTSLLSSPRFNVSSSGQCTLCYSSDISSLQCIRQV